MCFLGIATLAVGCSAFKPVPGHVSADPGLTGDASMVWRDAYRRSDAVPVVFVVEGAEITCSDAGNPGFECPTVGCRVGCTGSPRGVHLVDILPRSQGVLAHELWHVVEIRNGLATLLSSPATFEGMMQLGDRNHSGPAWQPGGDVDRANALLASRGR
jgi:hypothetical protein